jgi:hypothetical protein
MSTIAEPETVLPADGPKRIAFARADKFLSQVILACGIFTAGVGARQIRPYLAGPPLFVSGLLRSIRLAGRVRRYLAGFVAAQNANHCK